ncbi:MAG: efflux RND transporter periplasmic adaptor subunit [Pseudomonadales bacterium]
MIPVRFGETLLVAFRAFGLFGLTLVLLGGCTDESATPAGRTPGGARGPTLVVTAAAQPRIIRAEVEAIGTARANESVTITAKVTDTVSQVRFDDGGLVAAGDVLLELTNREETALLAEAQANVDDARTQLRRLENLLAQQTVPVSQVDEARARFAAAEARYQSVVARLADRLIRAPFSGLLGFRQVSEGTLITPGTAITTLDDVSVIKLDFSLPEIYLNLLHPGMELAAHSVAYPDRTFEATVRNIDSRVDPVTRAATVRAHIDNELLLLRPGMLLTVRLVTAQREALMVPEDALIQRGDQVFVYTVVDGHADIREVRHGDRYQGWVEIIDGLSPGEMVITEGVIKVRPGSPVRTADDAPEDLPGTAGTTTRPEG